MKQVQSRVRDAGCDDEYISVASNLVCNIYSGVGSHQS